VPEIGANAIADTASPGGGESSYCVAVSFVSYISQKPKLYLENSIKNAPGAIANARAAMTM
jgi:hypothetical protein